MMSNTPKPPLDQGLQDGMLRHFLAPPTDSKVESEMKREPFDFREHLSAWAKVMSLTRFKQH
jgi:hypothetical protein